ncbi:YchJ family metal-binding protein [Piscinibacter sp. XHJ-5]|uniref:YchJ family protein n=1 Tax=Piscinibacter sp. XHJ-5 TaxID=3037797 RepID=UPI0024532FE3|nr:YchJ family metal-binding protein [Piscinibacter sp. XHJ-5]
MSSSPCPCGSGLAYTACCGRFHAGAQHLSAPTPEALMRSRYSAFALGLHDYLLATWHRDTRPASLDPDPPGLQWLGLEVRRHEMHDADHGTVEFVARSKLGGRAHRLHEVSRFVREDGRWWYRDGDVAKASTQAAQPNRTA